MKLQAMQLGLALLAFSTLAGAQTGGQGAPGGPGGGQQGHPMQGEHPRRPPPKAIAACKGKAAGAACSFTGRNGEGLTGTCFSPGPGGQNAQAGNQAAPTTRPAACRPGAMAHGMGGGMERGGQPGQGGQGAPGRGPGG